MNIGVLAVLLSAFASAVYSVGQKSLIKKIGAIKFTSLTFWSGTICLLVFLPKLPYELQHASLTATSAAIYLGIFPSVIAYATWSIALKRLPVTKVTGTLYAMPIISTFLGWILLDEKIALLALGGGCMALVGSFIVQTKK